MEITEIRVFLAEEDRLKAYVTVTFDNCFVIRDLKVINGNNGLFVAMPSKKKKDGTYKDIAHPINADFRSYVEGKVLEKYQDESKMTTAGFPVKKQDLDDDYDDVPREAVIQTPNTLTDFDLQRELEAGVGPGSKRAD